MNELIAVLSGLIAAGALGFAIYNTRKNKKILDNVDRMLNEAIKGDFREEHFSESRVSKIESELSDYLSASSLSAENVRRDRDKIKTLIADISHQTKTPIANLLLHSELLEETELTDDQRESLDAIGNEAAKLRFLVDSLVKLSRLENGILTLDPVKDNVGRLIREIDSSLRKKAESKGLKFTVTEDKAEAVFDYKWTLEALSNIVENAIKHGRDPNADPLFISIRTRKTDSGTVIIVEDNGPGFDPSDESKPHTTLNNIRQRLEMMCEGGMTISGSGWK